MKIYTSIDNLQHGPFTKEELQKQYQEGAINARTPIWHDELGSWKKLGEVPNLLAGVEKLPPPLVITPPSVPVHNNPVPNPKAPSGRELADFPRRIGAFWLDAVIFGVGMCILLGISEVLSLVLAETVILPILINVVCWGIILLAPPLIMGYFMASKPAATPGMMITGIQIERQDGRRVTFWQGVWRNLATIFSGSCLYIGFLWALWDPQRQSWHDKMANTFVVAKGVFRE